MKMRMDYIAIIIVIVIGILYYNVVLNSPIVFGDEGYHTYIARWIAENRILPKYEVVWETRVFHPKLYYPPLFYTLESFFWLIGGEFFIKLLIPIFSILAALILYVFMKKINRSFVGLIAAFAFLMTPALVTYGVLAYTDTLLALMLICSIYFFYQALETKNKMFVMLTGIFTGLAILTKAFGTMLLPIIFFYWLINRKSFKFKYVFMIFLIASLLVLPWISRNIILFGGVCYHSIIIGPACDPYISPYPPTIKGLEFAGRTAEVGTEMSVWKMGLIPFSNFAFGLVITILFLMGIPFLVSKNENFSRLILLWFIAFVIIFLVTSIPLSLGSRILSNARAEDAARYMVGGLGPIAIAIGIFISNSYDWIKNKNHVLSILFVIVIMISISFYGISKIETMKAVKGWPSSFFEACDWIKANTPKDSILYSVYSQQTAFNCDRPATRPEPDNAEIELTGNDTAYEHLKLHGFTYIFVPQNQISSIPYAEAYYIGFINYIESSSHFKNVYDNTDRYGRNGVKIYQVL